MENSLGKKPSLLGDCLHVSQDKVTVKEIISVYSNHSSIQKIKSVFNTNSKFDLPKPAPCDINKIIKSLDPNRATGPDGIPAKSLQMSANVIDYHLSNIIACDISKTKNSGHAKRLQHDQFFKRMMVQKLKTTGLYVF